MSDVIADPDLDPSVRAEADAWSGCVAGALTRTDFESALAAAGFVDVAINETRRVHQYAASAIVRSTRSAG